jgi:RHS repeat-associated protein
MYDAFGNISKTGNPGGSFLPTYSPATNQFTLTGANVAYDANGNLLTDNLYSYTWDPNFGNPSSVTNQMGGNDSVYGLVYDALGRMVEQDDSFRECAIHICITSTPSQGQIVYGPDGQKLALASAQNLAKAFIQLPGGGAAIYDSSGLDYYRHADWQGSSRLTSTQGRAIYSISAYAPFGEQYAVTDTSDPSFTGQNSDTVSGLYDFLYRENSSSQGRWISPDPSGLSAADPNNPQSWNRYAYVANNPLSNIDRMGLDDSSIDGCANKNVDCVPGILDGISVLASDPAPTHVPFDPQNTANVNGGEGAIVPQQLFGLLFPNGIQSATNNGCNYIYICAAANNGTPQNPTTAHCVGQALAAKGLSIALDIAGAVPAFGNLFSGTVEGIQALNAGYYGTVALANAGNTLLNPSASGAASTAATIGLTVGSLALNGSKVIPVVGNLVSLGTAVYDTTKAVQAYQQCMAGGG